MLADVGLAAAVLTRMPPGVMVTTVSTSLDHLAPAPQDGSLIAVCRAGPCGESDMHHAVGEIRDANGMLHARATGWLLLGNAPVAAQAAPAFPQEPRGSHVLDLLQASEETEADHVAVRFLVRPSLSNLMGVLHGGIGAIACEALAEMALGPGSRLLNSSFAYLRPVREGTIATVTTEMVRRGRRTAVLRARLLTGTGATSLQVCVVAEVTPPCEQSKSARPGWSSD
jgi:acyl-coenzyme A thioesterase PaaI-like protein